MIVLVVEIEQHVTVRLHRARDRFDRPNPRRLGREDRIRLPAKLPRSQQDELEDHPARADVLHELPQPRATRRRQLAVGLIDRHVPVRPHANEPHTPPFQGVEIRIHRRGDVERAKHADAQQERGPTIDEQGRPRRAERRARHRISRADP